MASAESLTDYVYHVTLSNRLGSLTEGLFPNHDHSRDEDWQEFEKYIDSEVPSPLAVRGIARATSVFALAEAQHFEGVFQAHTKSSKKGPAHLVALRIEV